MLSLFSIVAACFVMVSAQPGGLGGPGGPGGIGGIGGPGGIGGIGGPGGIGGIGGPGGISGLGNVGGLSQQQQYANGYYPQQQGYPQATSTSSPSFLDRVLSMSSNAIRGLTGQPQQVQSQQPYYNYNPQTVYNPAYTTAGAGTVTSTTPSQSIPAMSTSSINTNTQPIATTTTTQQTAPTRTPLTLANSALQELFGEGVTMPPISDMNPPPNTFPFANPSTSFNSNSNIPSAVVIPSTNAASPPSTTITSAVNTDLLQRLRQRVVSPVNTGVSP